MGSQGRGDTAGIARSFGAKLVQFHYAGGWPKKRQWAMETLPLVYDWELLIDADEALTPELAEEGRHAIQDPRFDGYYSAPQTLFLCRGRGHAGSGRAKRTRFPRGKRPSAGRPEDQDVSLPGMDWDG